MAHHEIDEGRRALVTRLGGAALALPFLHALERPARAATPAAPNGRKAPRNLVIFYTPNGVYHQNYWPRGGETDFQLNVAMEPLQKYRDKLLILGPKFAGPTRAPMAGTGLEHIVKNAGAGGHPPQHQAQVFLTGDPVKFPYSQQTGDGLTVHTGQPSLDQLVANTIGARSRFRSLEFGLHPVGGDTPSTINFAMDGSPMPRMVDSAAAWSRIFGGVVDAPKGGMSAPMGPDQRRVAVSNFLKKRFANLGPRLGKDDRLALERHLAALREVEARVLTAPIATSGCTPSGVKLDPIPGGAAFMEVPAVASNFEQMIALAFACDVTRVASVTFGYPGGGGVGGLHPVWLGINNAHHQLSHHGGDAAKTGPLTQLMKWFGLQVAQMLDQLARYPHPDGDGTLLDHTIVLWGSRHGEGNGHTNESLPCLLAGGGAEVFGPTGRFLNLPGTNWCSLLLSLARAYGVQLDGFGLGTLRTTETIKELGIS
jgi:hypothetical protein